MIDGSGSPPLSSVSRSYAFFVADLKAVVLGAGISVGAGKWCDAVDVDASATVWGSSSEMPRAL